MKFHNRHHANMHTSQIMIICQIRKRVNGPKSELYHGVAGAAYANTLESTHALRPTGTGLTDTGIYKRRPSEARFLNG